MGSELQVEIGLRGSVKTNCCLKLNLETQHP